jgi:hypothetical protein
VAALIPRAGADGADGKARRVHFGASPVLFLKLTFFPLPAHLHCDVAATLGVEQKEKKKTSCRSNQPATGLLGVLSIDRDNVPLFYFLVPF